MKCVVELSQAEEMTLQQLSINHRHRHTRTRAAALLMLGRRIKPKVVAEQLGVSGQSVYNGRTHGVTAVCAACWVVIRPPALSDAMITAALEVARAESLSLAQIGQCVQAFHGQPLPCPTETLGDALKREGFSFKRNRYALKKCAPKMSSS